MKLTVLVDNNTLIDRYFCGEPGVSYLIDCEEAKILFEKGYANTFVNRLYYACFYAVSALLLTRFAIFSGW